MRGSVREVRLSPHFTLGQFVCKQAGGYPKYVVLRERLLLKLERLLEAVNAKGHAAETFHVMSGYRRIGPDGEVLEPLLCQLLVRDHDEDMEGHRLTVSYPLR